MTQQENDPGVVRTEIRHVATLSKPRKGMSENLKPQPCGGSTGWSLKTKSIYWTIFIVRMPPWKDIHNILFRKKGNHLPHRITVLALRIFKKGLSLGNESVWGFYFFFFPFARLSFLLVQLTHTAFAVSMKNTVGVVKGDSRSPSSSPWWPVRQRVDWVTEVSHTPEKELGPAQEIVLLSQHHAGPVEACPSLWPNQQPPPPLCTLL